MKHFTDIDNISKEDLKSIINRSKIEKKIISEKGSVSLPKTLLGKTVAMIFEKPSTRTRASFEVGINQLGGNSMILKSSDLQLSRGETVADTARVLSRYVDAIIIRCYDHSMMTEFSQHSSVPIINGLTDFTHPCQVIADILTIEEFKGEIEDQKVVWIGDGNNVAASWLEASTLLKIDLTVCTPKNLTLPETLISKAKDNGALITIESDPKKALFNKDVVITDTWVSMGDDASNRENSLLPYQVNKPAMGLASKEAIFMHCLPAHRGHEVTDDVIDGPQSVVFEEAENRMHVQRAIFWWCFS